MAAITFPQNPTLNQEYTPAGGTVTYKWNGTFWQLASAGIANSASFAISAGSASFATTSSFSTRSITSSFSLTGVTASFATTASFVETAQTASFALTASLLASTASDAVSASYALTASNVQTSSFSFSSSLARTASYALTASNVQTSSFSLTASLARTASFLAGTASRAVSSSYALTASKVETSSFAFTSSTAFTSSWAINAVNGGSVVVVSASVPQTNSVSGTLWWNTENGNLYVQTEGPTGSQWAPANATVGTSAASDTASFAFTASYIDTASLASTASYFSGSGAEIYNIPAAAILDLAAISSGSATASFKVNGANRSLQINTNTAITGTLTTTRIIADTASFIFSTTVFETSSISFVTGSTKFGSLSTNTHEFTGSVEITGSLSSKGNATVTGSVEITGSLLSRGNLLVSGSVEITGSLLSIGNLVVSGSTNTVGNTTISGSFVLSGSLNLHQSASVSGTNMFGTASWAAQGISSSFANTASFVNNLSQSVTITGSLTVFTGSGVEFQVTNTGVKIGSALTASHLITGSVGVTGSFTVFSNNSPEFRVLDNGTFIGNAQTDVHRITGSAGITGSLTVVGGGITGSLLGLATSASFAVSASSAPTNIRYQEISIPSTSNIGATAVDLVTFVLPVAGTYRVTQVIRGEVSSTASVPTAYLTNNSNILVPSSVLLLSFNRIGQSTVSQTSYITTTATNEIYKSRASCATAGIMNVLTDGNGDSKVAWERIA